MTGIMFVCLGNICRSPMAEFVFGDIAAKAGRRNDYLVASSATSSENVFNGTGAEVYPPAKRILAKHGLSCEGKCAVQLRRDDYGKYDLFICMDKYNVSSVMRIFGSDPENKIHRLMDYTGRPGDVSDPWYTGDFDTAYEDILDGCEALFSHLENR